MDDGHEDAEPVLPEVEEVDESAEDVDDTTAVSAEEGTEIEVSELDRLLEGVGPPVEAFFIYIFTLQHHTTE